MYLQPERWWCSAILYSVVLDWPLLKGGVWSCSRVWFLGRVLIFRACVAVASLVFISLCWSLPSFLDEKMIIQTYNMMLYPHGYCKFGLAIHFKIIELFLQLLPGWFQMHNDWNDQHTAGTRPLPNPQKPTNTFTNSCLIPHMCSPHSFPGKPSILQESKATKSIALLIECQSRGLWFKYHSSQFVFAQPKIVGGTPCPSIKCSNQPISPWF